MGGPTAPKCSETAVCGMLITLNKVIFILYKLTGVLIKDNRAILTLKGLGTGKPLRGAKQIKGSQIQATKTSFETVNDMSTPTASM